jgi:hypothetical protein
MHLRSWDCQWALLGLALAVGCTPAPQPPPLTAAGETARDFFQAVIRQDWEAAYDFLAPETRARYDRAQFARLGASYHRNLGFEPEHVIVRQCDERGSEALAHVIIVGRTAAREQRVREGLTLRQSEAGWGVVLPENFGQVRSQ